MPKAQPHFDAAALLTAVHQQDLGLRVSTNNPTRFREIIYAHGRAAAHLRVHVYACPRSASAFWLLKAPLPQLAELNDNGGQDLG